MNAQKAAGTGRATMLGDGSWSVELRVEGQPVAAQIVSPHYSREDAAAGATLTGVRERAWDEGLARLGVERAGPWEAVDGGARSCTVVAPASLEVVGAAVEAGAPSWCDACERGEDPGREWADVTEDGGVVVSHSREVGSVPVVEARYAAPRLSVEVVRRDTHHPGGTAVLGPVEVVLGGPDGAVHLELEGDVPERLAGLVREAAALGRRIVAGTAPGADARTDPARSPHTTWAPATRRSVRTRSWGSTSGRWRSATSRSVRPGGSRERVSRSRPRTPHRRTSTRRPWRRRTMTSG